jgi:hypothetical protein
VPWHRQKSVACKGGGPRFAAQTRQLCITRSSLRCHLLCLIKEEPHAALPKRQCLVFSFLCALPLHGPFIVSHDKVSLDKVKKIIIIKLKKIKLVKFKVSLGKVSLDV